jgi:hypothetical protein
MEISLKELQITLLATLHVYASRMSFEKRIIKVWKLCEDYNGAVLSVQFHMPGMPKKEKKQTELPLFIASAIKKLLSGHWMYMIYNRTTNSC